MRRHVITALVGWMVACGPKPPPFRFQTEPFPLTPSRSDWRTRLDTTPAGRLAVVGGLLVTGTGDGQVLALDPATGKIRWRRKDRVRLKTTWMVCDSLLYIVKRSGSLPITAVDLQTGRTRIRIRGGSVEGEPVALGDLLVLFLEKGQIWGLRGSDGQLRWKSKISGNLRGSPAVGDSNLFGITDGGRLFSLTLNGKIRWLRDLGERFVAGPVWTEGFVFVGSLSGTLFAINGATGGLLWSTRLGGKIHVPPAADARRVFAITGRGRLSALESHKGTSLWEVDLGSPGAGLLVNGGTLYVGTQAERLYQVEAETGRIRHTWIVKGRIKTPPVVFGNRVFVGTDHGWIYGFRLSE